MDDAGEAARRADDDRDGQLPQPEPLSPGLAVTLVLAVVLGGLAGFAVSGVAYLVVHPVLEENGIRLVQLQGLLWSVVPLGTLVGIFAGGALLRRRRRRSH